MTPAERRLSWMLRGIGLLDLLAFVAMVLPVSELGRVHADLGLGDFPEQAITVYLARTGSMLYGFCGLLLLFLSTNVVRFGPVIRFLATAGVCASGLLLWIDLQTGMPWWWAGIESTVCATLWAAVLTCERLSHPSSTESHRDL